MLHFHHSDANSPELNEWDEAAGERRVAVCHSKQKIERKKYSTDTF